MNKYDCTKSEDLIHEINRMCSSIKNCCDCQLNNPFYHCSMEANKISNDVIDIVQKWSDKHPENPPKLTRKEYDFLKSFADPYQKHIVHGNDYEGCVLFFSSIGYKLNKNMFKFIQASENNSWSLEELLELEVEDD